jgi:hypothetical protein
MKCKSVARVQTHFKSAFSDLPEKDATSEKLGPISVQLRCNSRG